MFGGKQKILFSLLFVIQIHAHHYAQTCLCSEMLLCVTTKSLNI